MRLQGELICPQKLVLTVPVPIFPHVAVLGIAEDGRSDVCQMGTNLMRPPRDQVDSQKSMAFVSSDDTIAGDDLLKSRLLFVQNGDGVVTGGFLVPCVKHRLLLPWRSYRHTEVGLADAVFPNETVDLPQCCGSFGGDDNSAGVAVQPVAECWCSACFLRRTVCADIGRDSGGYG